MKTKLNIFLFLILLLCVTTVEAQETFVVGQVINSTDKSPIPSASVCFKSTQIAVKTNAEGFFAIKNAGKETTLVFSCIGFKTKELKLKAGSSVGVDVELDEISTELSEVFVVPGVNKGWEWIKKIRAARRYNDITLNKKVQLKGTEQNLVLLSKITRRNTSNKLFEQLKTASLLQNDTLLTVPLYMSELEWEESANQKVLQSKNTFQSDKMTESLIEKLFGELKVSLNFYNNTVTILDKNFVSPLANVGSLYYNYMLFDSLQTANGKEYVLKFKAKNPKDLAFNGQLQFDSASLALTSIKAELSPRANVNFIHNLFVNQQFKLTSENIWLPDAEQLALKMNYILSHDSLKPQPEIFVKRSVSYSLIKGAILSSEGFANSKMAGELINQKMDTLYKSPLMQTARWIAKVIFTGYVPVGIFDIGKIQTLMRYTDLEGVRLNIPFSTNGKLWENVSVGGHLGYGFTNKELKYSANINCKLPTELRYVFGLKYCDDYRLNNYDYNNFLYYENTLVTGDEDFSSTIMAFRKGTNLNNRKELTASFSGDWNTDLETSLYLRSHQYLSNSFLPLQQGSNTYNTLWQRSATVAARWSFDEKTYEDHLRRIYIPNFQPVLYAVMEYGNYSLGQNNGNYTKVTAAIKQKVRLDVGVLNYMLEGNYLFGSVPYPLLFSPHGNSIGAYSFYGFNTMRQMEFVTDKYMGFHTDLTLNGLILNRIPLIRNLNLRELCSFHMMYGSLSPKHSSILNVPTFTQSLNKPFMEVGVGVSNIFKLFAVQSIWRLSQLNNPNIEKWVLMTSFCVSF